MKPGFKCPPVPKIGRGEVPGIVVASKPSDRVQLVVLDPQPRQSGGIYILGSAISNR